GRGDVLLRADRKARVFVVGILPTDAEPSAKSAGTAGVRDQLETQNAGREFAFDDLDRRDHGAALIHGDARSAVLGGAGAGAAGDDLVLHIALARVGAAPADDDRAAAAAVGAHLLGHDVAE